MSRVAPNVHLIVGGANMRLRVIVGAVAAASFFLSPAVANAASVDVASASSRCTMTSTHHCIRGGEFCPKSAYGHVGYDASGRRYVCKGNRAHPHWMK